MIIRLVTTMAIVAVTLYAITWALEQMSTVLLLALGLGLVGAHLRRRHE